MNVHDDCRYWNLTLPQCVRYHGRLTRYYSHLAKQNAARATKLANLAQTLALVTLAIVTIALGAQLLG